PKQAYGRGKVFLGASVVTGLFCLGAAGICYRDGYTDAAYSLACSAGVCTAGAIRSVELIMKAKKYLPSNSPRLS
ncbi:MAG: hypothetical protein PHE27_08055, partial [Alphaproteobacteria bacterium]|nr:hypothetical protein [Alphaproteobacteria bacterium]